MTLPYLSTRQSGILLGLFSSTTFGMIPLFTLPLLQAGICAQTALAYRFTIAAVLMWFILTLKKEHYFVDLKTLLKLFLLSALYLMAVIFFFYGFSYLSSGAVATIQFLYPVMVMIIMVLFFHERFTWPIVMALVFAVIGVGLLSSGPELEPALEPGFAHAPILPFGSDVFWGVTLSLLAGLWNALYMVGIQVARLPKITGLVMTFYVMVFGALLSFINAFATNSLQWISSLREISLAFCLAIVTAVISNLTLIMAIKRIGSTLTSILGVMEPLTAVFVGIMVFGEPFTLELSAGVILIIVSVLLVMLLPVKKPA